MRRAVAGAAGSSKEGCSSTGARVGQGGAAAGTGEGAGVALVQEQPDGLRRRAHQPEVQKQAIPGECVARWQEREPGCICQR